MLPPWSVPMAISTSPAATSAAPPEVLPPAEYPRAYGFSMVPCALVNDAVELQKCSQVAVPRISAPASRTRVTTVASVLGVQGGNASVP